MQPDTNTPNFQPAQPTPKRWRISNRYLFGGVVILLLIVAAFLILSNSSSKDSSSAAKPGPVYYDRPGFDRKKLSSSIGDPAALTMKQTAQPVSYQGVKVVQACSVFGVDDIKQTGLTLRPHSLTVAFQRDYFDGQGKGALRPSTSGLEPVGSDSNDCQYTIEAAGNPETLWIQVFQPPYSPVASLNAGLSSRFQDAGQIGGLKAYQYSDQTASIKNTTTILRSGDSALQITTSVQDPAKLKAVLERAAANFSRLLGSPDGPPKVGFDSPLMPDGFANACELLQPGDVKTMFSEEASPIVTEGATTAVAVIRFGSDESKRTNYVVHECERGAVVSETDAFSFNNRRLKLEATTYRDEQGAQQDVGFHQARDKNVKTLSTKLGDSAFFSGGIGGGTTELTVRKGKVVLRLSNSDKQANQDQLVSLAKTITGRL